MEFCLQCYEDKQLQHLIGLFTTWYETVTSSKVSAKKLHLAYLIVTIHPLTPGLIRSLVVLERLSSPQYPEVVLGSDYIWLVAEPIQVPLHRTACPCGKVLAFQKGGWDKTQTAKAQNTAHTPSSKVCQSSESSVGERKEVFWPKKTRWKIGQVSRTSHPFLGLLGWVGHEQVQVEGKSIFAGETGYKTPRKQKKK